MRAAQDESFGSTEYSIITPDATLDEVSRAVLRAEADGAIAIRTAGVYTARLKRLLAGPRLMIVVAAVSFPNGSSKSTIKAIEATAAIKDGADEIDVQPHLPNYLAGDLDAARTELLEIVRACRACRRDVRINVMLDVSRLLKRPEAERLLEVACQAIREGACDGIEVEHVSPDVVRLLKSFAKELTLKATIGSFAPAGHAQSLLDAGAARISVKLSNG